VAREAYPAEGVLGQKLPKLTPRRDSIRRISQGKGEFLSHEFTQMDTDFLTLIALRIQRTIPKILRYSFIVIVLLINQKDYEHLITVWVFV
jgi:hypothetical protein